MFNQQRQNFERVRVHLKFMMIRLELFGNAPRVFAFVVIPSVRKADGKGFDLRIRNVRHERDNRAGIYAAAQERAERHVADEPAAHRFLQAFPHFHRVIPRHAARHFGGGIAIAGKRNRPVAVNRDFAVHVFQHMPGGQLVDFGENRFRRRHIQHGEVILQRGEIQLARHGRILQQRFDFGRKQNAVAPKIIKKRLHADAVAAKQQRPALAIPQREREHAVQARHKLLAHFFVEMDEHLRVGLRFEFMPFGFQFAAQFFEIVNFSIIDDRNGVIFIGNRLMAGV